MDAKKLKNDVIISYLSIIISIFITFFFTKIQTKYLGKELYGVLSLINSTIGYIAILDLGVGQTIITYISKFKTENKISKIEELAGYSFKNYIRISLIGLFIGIIIIFNSEYIFNSLSQSTIRVFNICFFIALMNMLLQIPGATFNAILSGYKRFKLLKTLDIVKTIVRALISTILLMIGCSIISIFVVDLIVNQCVNVFRYIVVKKELNLKLKFKPIEKELKREINSYSFFIFLGIITDQIFWKSDTVLLGIISTSSIVAVYSISGQIISQFLMICSTFSSVFLPTIIEKISAHESKKEINEFFTKASRYQFMLVGMIIISFIFIGKDFIRFWVGKDFEHAYYYTIIIMISLIVPMFQTTGYQILYAMNKHRVRSVIYLINALLNIIMSIVLFYLIGPIGVAISTAISMILGNTLLMNIYYKKVLELKLISFFKNVCLRTGIAIIVTALLYFLLDIILPDNQWIFILKGSIATFFYSIAIYLFSLNKNEKNQIKKVFLKKIK